VSLRAIILEAIRERGPMPFSRYMELCLYHPELGYYHRAQERFGKAGDFYTSSDLHAIFGRLLARQFEEMWRVLGSPARVELLELGPGRGLFMRDVLDWSAHRYPDFYAALHVTLVESSLTLRAKLEGNLAAHIADGKATLARSLGHVPQSPNSIVFANEFFDALPVDVISDIGELRIAAEAERFREQFVRVRPEVLDYLKRFSIHPRQGERVEANLAALDHLHEIAERMQRGFFVAVDYGYTREEQLAGRHLDTIMCYRQHTSSEDPYEAPGEQDITAHVNFTALREEGKRLGLEELGLLTQSQFLMGIGDQDQFADALEGAHLPQEQAKRILQLKHLVTPAGIGETFHVLVMSRAVEKEKAARLSGLRFGRP
jgi:SAM-dependent MidA family methyltransferase